MKGRFSTIDIVVIVEELKRYVGMRVVNVYDIDNKTYLIRVGKPDEKDVILIESGIRIHSTEFDWPKNPAPSGFSMKLRKHLKNRRFESIQQIGIDRIVDLQFGSGEAAYHVIVELYDRGNIVLTDFEYTILNILRPRTDNEQDVRYAVRETYPTTSGKQHQSPTLDRLKELIIAGKEGDVLKKLLVPHLDYGPAILDHVLLGAGFQLNVKLGQGFHTDSDISRLYTALEEAEELFTTLISKPCKGFIIQKKDKRTTTVQGESEDMLLYDEFHPFLFRQHEKQPTVEFDCFRKSVDEFFSKIESQRMDLKVINQEKTALKKLDNVKKDHEKRLQGLQKEQETDILRGQLIEMNLELVDQAILIVRSALANQIDWSEIWGLVKEAQLRGDSVAQAIKALRLDANLITLLLTDPYAAADENQGSEASHLKPMRVDIDLGTSAYGNSRKFFDKKKIAAKKTQRTIEASNKAFKSAEKKTKQTLKDVAVAASINKTRKTYWFEKFLWFISSENYLVIGGRDQQQNEQIYRRYLRDGDLYVHADLHGASSCVVKNPSGLPVPPKTLNEAGTMAICNSAAWDSKVVTSAWWVTRDQVSKTAPTGEYLTTGSFMIRGKKNFLPPSYLVYGFGFLFKLEEGSVERHMGERKVRVTDEDDAASSVSGLDSVVSVNEDDVEIDISDSSDSDNDEKDEKSAGSDQMADKQNQKDDDDGLENESMESDKIENNKVSEEHIQSESKSKKDQEDKRNINISSDPTEETKEKSEGFVFPDTNISLTHVKGDKYELKSATDNSENTFDGKVNLGDGELVARGPRTANKSGKMSAKQRRDMKKGKKGPIEQEESDEDEVSWLSTKKVEANIKDKDDTAEANSSKDPQNAPAKRGQKAKLKKMKDKYGDQDEEERQLRMEILASSGPQKEDKKKKKKGGPPQKNQRPNSSKPNAAGSGPFRGQDVKFTQGTGQENEIAKSEDGAKREAEQNDSDGEKEVVQDDVNTMNSLTGLPVSEDELLYAIPVCAPYNALLNYKFKVKLMPGTTKKGKAVKTALNMFVHDKAISSREKDLLKIQKDTDLARNVPGKVKVAAPNLHKKKR